jgi:hypothetical protein
MRFRMPLSLLAMVLFFFSIMGATLINVDDRIHVTGCENGELVVPIVNLWSKPGGVRAGATVVGKVSGDGRADQGLRCQGSVVIVREQQTVSGRDFVKVETVVGDQVGWITDSFVGRKFDTSQCASFFRSDPVAAQKCAR